MAIIIPSKYIFNKNNPKVRDNVIERIEVGAVEVVPDNDYETPVYNDGNELLSSNLSFVTQKNSNYDGQTTGATGGGMASRYISACYTAFTNQKSFKKQIKIPVVKTSSSIVGLLTGLNKEGNENIKYTLWGKTKKGDATAKWNYTQPNGTTKIELVEDTIVYGSIKEESKVGTMALPSYVEITEKSNIAAISSSSKTTLIPWGNVKTATSTKETIDGEEYFIIDLEFPVSVTSVAMKYYKFWNGTQAEVEQNTPTKLDLKGEYIIYEPTKIEITIYGNTIGIDLQDKTVYINGDTSKKVHSIDGNELMQTNILHSSPLDLNKLLVEYDYSNLKVYIVRNDTDLEYEASAKVKILLNGEETSTKNVVIKQGETRSSGLSIASVEQTAFITEATKTEMLIKTLYSTTQEQYANGKETATILCSISDYYDYDTKKKVISIEGGGLPMKFNLYDEVVPMVYGYDGKDRPMSLYKDGTPKRFQVLGTKIYYDGAVWQELSLQEI